MNAVVGRRALSVMLAGLLSVGVVSALPASAADGPTLSVGDQSGLERDAVAGSVFVPIYLSEPVAEPVVVSYWTVDGDAVNGVDYSRWGTPSVPRTVTIPAGSTQTQVNVPVLADDQAEDDETFSLTATATGAGVVIGDDTGTATIVDADTVSEFNPAVTVSNPTVVEGDTGQRRAQFLIHLSRAPASPVTVTYTTTDSTAVAGEDYVAKLPGTVVFAPGQISKTIDVLVNPNTDVDGPRAFTLEVAVTGGSPVEELTMVGTATITDDDTAPAEPCPPGTFNPTDGNAPCTPAPPGFFVATAGALSATLCAPGSFQDQAGQTSCQLAPIGSYVENSGAAAATTCPDGTTTTAVGATSPDSCVPQPLPALTVAAGGWHNCALLADSTIRCWGDNFQGQLGNGTTTTQNGAVPVPVQVTGVATATSITAGSSHSCAILLGGSVTCWGRNLSGQLGNGTTAQSSNPVPVSGITDATAITAGDEQTCALRSSGAVWCWGRIVPGGPFGGGSSSSVPVAISGITTATAISAGGNHVCALLQDRSVRCWGSNSNGQLGNGTTSSFPASTPTPVAVTGISTAAALGAGSSHSCALLTDGALRCWGSNSWGQLGNGTQTQSSTPVPVSGIADATAVGAAGVHSCAVLGAGTTHCWGRNDGRLGNGTTTESSIPVHTTGIDSATQVVAGRTHTCVRVTDGAISCWGDNTFGQLGDGTTSASNVPVAVVSIP